MEGKRLFLPRSFLFLPYFLFSLFVFVLRIQSKIYFFFFTSALRQKISNIADLVYEFWYYGVDFCLIEYLELDPQQGKKHNTD